MLIMTSNLGSAMAEKGSIGFGVTDNSRDDSMDAVKKHLAPEFRNRLDATTPVPESLTRITFNGLQKSS